MVRLHRHLREVGIRRDAGADGRAAQIRGAEPTVADRCTIGIHW